MLIIIEPKDVEVELDNTIRMITLKFKRPFECGKDDMVIINKECLESAINED